MIYADNAATTRMSEAAVQAMFSVIREDYGNPSSLYSLGQRAKEILEDLDWLDNLRYVGQNIGCSSRHVPEDPLEKAVYLALEKGALGFDELVQVTGMAPPTLMSTLTVMQIRKMIDALPGKRYQIRH